MTTDPPWTEDDAVDALQALGCREYEAKCFVALTRLPNGTAREVSETTEIPQSRVYDAMEDLEAKGLIEVHFSTPKRFRAVPLTEAVAWFRDRFERQLEQFEQSIESLAPLTPRTVEDEPKVWSLNGLEAIRVRVNNLLQSANREVVIYIDSEEQFNREMLRTVDTATDVEVRVLTPTAELKAFAESVLNAGATVAVIDLPVGSTTQDEQTGSPMTVVLVDGSSVLLRTRSRDTETSDEAIIVEGRQNGVVRWLAQLLGG